MEYYSITWRRLHTDTHTLAQKIIKGNQKYDLIVAIARGGFTISHILTDFLRLPVASFTVSSYKDLKQVGNPEIAFEVGGNLKGKRILLVDDCSDTGKTFIRGMKYLKELGAESVGTASPYIKPWTKVIPDFYVRSTKKWIVFPFDVRETIEAIQRRGLTDAQVREELKTIKFFPHLVNHYVK